MTQPNRFLYALLSTGLLLTPAAAALAAESITTSTARTGDDPMSRQTITDPRAAAESFVAHVNYARVALAMKDGVLARQHIMQARNMSAVLANASIEQKRVAHVRAGRVVYEYETERKTNYFPIETGPSEVKSMSTGPIWAENSLAVQDAEIVTLTLDLTQNKPESYFTAAEADITAGKFKEAEVKLAELSDAVVSVDNRMALPLDKAHDNIGIAQNFIRGKNYDGARFALSHADDALNDMWVDNAYRAHHPAITAMRKEISDMRETIKLKDPTALQKVGTNLSKWMTELKSWARS